MASEYEKLRQKNLEDNKKILAELGLLNPFQPLPRVIKKAPKRKRVEPVAKKEVKYVDNTKNDVLNLEDYGSQTDGSRRKSSRLSGQAPLSYKDIEEQSKKWAEEECEEGEEGDTPRRASFAKRPMVYGPIPGVEVGTIWPMRIDCNAAGIHRPTVAGIHGGPEGAYSIVLSAGYEDNIDLGTCFTYTGEGGRDLKGTSSNPKNLRTAAQSKDQCLSKGNAGLVKSVETKMPLRVIRGFKLTSPFAPEDGYRYDGLYRCEKWWFTTGMAGYGVFKFALKRLEDQAPVPWTLEGEMVKDSDSQSADNESETAVVESETGVAESETAVVESEEGHAPTKICEKEETKISKESVCDKMDVDSDTCQDDSPSNDSESETKNTESENNKKEKSTDCDSA